MAKTMRIGLIGDYNPEVAAHVAIPRALELAARHIEKHVDANWLATPFVEQQGEELLATFDALWCVPASPYESMEGALIGIRYAREHNIPFLGTCGGFQHTLIEYARNVLGLHNADHAESNPDAEFPLIAPLMCSLREVSDTITLKAGSRIATIYSKSEIVEQYNCSFGLHPEYQALFEQSALRITGVFNNGEARVVELTEHPFFIATLFQPERSAFTDSVHPLIEAYLRAI